MGNQLLEQLQPALSKATSLLSFTVESLRETVNNLLENKDQLGSLNEAQLRILFKLFDINGMNRERLSLTAELDNLTKEKPFLTDFVIETILSSPVKGSFESAIKDIPVVDSVKKQLYLSISKVLDLKEKEGVEEIEKCVKKHAKHSQKLNQIRANMVNFDELEAEYRSSQALSKLSSLKKAFHSIETGLLKLQEAKGTARMTEVCDMFLNKKIQGVNANSIEDNAIRAMKKGASLLSQSNKTQEQVEFAKEERSVALFNKFKVNAQKHLKIEELSQIFSRNLTKIDDIYFKFSDVDDLKVRRDKIIRENKLKVPELRNIVLKLEESEYKRLYKFLYPTMDIGFVSPYGVKQTSCFTEAHVKMESDEYFPLCYGKELDASDLILLRNALNDRLRDIFREKISGEPKKMLVNDEFLQIYTRICNSKRVAEDICAPKIEEKEDFSNLEANVFESGEYKTAEYKLKLEENENLIEMQRESQEKQKSELEQKIQESIRKAHSRAKSGQKVREMDHNDFNFVKNKIDFLSRTSLQHNNIFKEVAENPENPRKNTFIQLVNYLSSRICEEQVKYNVSVNRFIGDSDLSLVNLNKQEMEQTVDQYFKLAREYYSEDNSAYFQRKGFDFIEKELNQSYFASRKEAFSFYAEIFKKHRNFAHSSALKLGNCSANNPSATKTATEFSFALISQ